MKLTDRVFLVGSGRLGFSMTNDFDCHVYLVDGGSELALIDAGVGMQTELILEKIRADGLDPQNVNHLLLTHAHADHGGGSAILKKQLNVAVALHEAEAPFLEGGNEDEVGLNVARGAGYYPADYHLAPCGVDTVLRDAQEMTIGDLSISALHLPGHSRGSVCYIMSDGESRYCFSGDTVFLNGGIGLLNCVGSSLGDYRSNVGKLAGLEIDVLLPGHLSVVLSGGQRHLDMAIENLKSLMPPKNAF